jgi:hypothetical protein
MTDVNMAAFTAPKSDQLNADDLIGGPRTITVSGVRANDGGPEQPVSIDFAGDDGKPYKPCKSMRRVMVHVWGADAKQYIGRSMTLYCDPGVQFGGMKVGGIRISHMSHIDKAQTMALTATRAKRAPFTVHPLQTPAPPPTPVPVQLFAPAEVAALLAAYDAATTAEKFTAAEQLRKDAWTRVLPADKITLKAKSDEIKALLATPAAAEGAK